ncbi:MAG: phosphatase PAP2-related protein [bacterium]
MKIWFQKFNDSFKDRYFITSFLVGLLFFFISLVINFIAGTYATERASLPVTDIILSNIRVFDVDAIFIYGPVIFWTFAGLVLLYNPKKIPFTLKSIALFVVVRSIFISLTHIGPFPTQAIISSSDFFSKFTFGGDLFFSGHTGLPFLMALIFWREKKLRYIFIISSLIFGAVVLMGHLHYSIDVLAAFFITYTIYHMAEFFFKKERSMFLN